MKKSLLSCFGLALIFLTGISISVSGQNILASWSYDALLAASDAVPTASVINADYGILSSGATVYLDGTNGSSAWISVTTNPELTAFTGSTVNDPRSAPNAGMALALANSSANGKSVIFKFATTGYSDISISFATRGTGTGFNTHVWEWSTDNVTYTSFGTNTANTTSTFTQNSIDMSGIAAINNVPAVYVKLTLSGATSTAGNNRIDNFVVGAATDLTPPVPSFNPANAATDVLVDIKPTITFDEPVRKTDGTELTDADLTTLVIFKKTDASGTDVPFTAAIDANKKIITVTPSAVLDNSQIYYLAVGAIEDASGNESTLKSISFTTISATTPVVAVTGPAGGETFHAGDPATITWTSSNITNVMIEAWAREDATTWDWNILVASYPAVLGQFDLTIPADAMYGTEYKIRISDASNPSVNSTSANFTIIGVATSLSDLKTNFLQDDIVKLNSEVTVTFLRPANRNQKYIQDADAGLLIDDPSGILTTVVTVGDNIAGLEGKLGYYGGMLQIVPTVATVTVASSGNIVTIPEMTIPEYTASYLDYESMLIKLENVYFTAADGSATFAASANYTLTDGTNNLIFRTFFAGDGNIVGTVIPVNHLNLTAIAGFYNTTIQVYARTTDDFQLLSSEKAITSFAFNGLTPAVTGIIDQGAKTIALTVPDGTNVTALVPTIEISANATVTPASGVAANFTTPATYTVTAEDGTTASYTVTVSFATGVEDVKGSNMKIYPVPAGSELVVTNVHGVKLIEILDATGKVMNTVNAIETDELRIPVSNLNSGMYFIRFTTENGKVIRRFIKQ